MSHQSKTSIKLETLKQRTQILPFLIVVTLALITNIYGTPDISEISGETTPFKEVQFYDTPTSTRGTANGTLIGVGRARSMQFNAGVAGSSSSNNTSVYRLYLFDLRPFTIITLSDTPSPLLTATHADGVQVKGVTSGATGFVFGEGTSATNVNLTNVLVHLGLEKKLLHLTLLSQTI